ncbi:uncharacterized protein LOC132951472 [Metopolophium dirhodum]|uniref:uncharacterized protein LOC132951472 n=1 Tax=Metopolophium dirhodum TaxID=44670 RepID=UPI00298FA9C3|nr:uncharacterized protein LOC132951472 [Metopolophium dirhodum]
MFKRVFPSSDAMATNQAATGYIPTPPPPAGYIPTPPPPAGYIPTPPPSAGYIPTPPAGSIATPPANVPFALQQFGHQQPPGFTAFTPDYQHFPYTFSSITPPAYSWANTNSTHVMKFTGSSNPLPLDTSTYHPNNFGSVPKRKIDLDAELTQPPKMRITEEKVSASLRDMHISSEFKPHNYCVSSAVSEMDTVENPSLMETANIPETAKTDSQTTLVMCEELRKLHKIDSIIPQPLLTKVERPTNAVVVWNNKPLVELVRSFSQYQEPKSTVVITEITDEEENEINSRDVMCVEENNCIAVEDVNMEL